MAGLLIALLAGLPWWGWVLLIVLGLVVGGWWAVGRARAAADAHGDESTLDTAPPTPAAPPPTSHPGPPPDVPASVRQSGTYPCAPIGGVRERPGCAE